MSKQSRTAALSLMAMFLIACAPFAGTAGATSAVSGPNEWTFTPNAPDSGRMLNLAALDGKSARLSVAMLREAKRDYTIVVVDDDLLQEPASPARPESDLAAVTPSLAVASDNHHGGASFEDGSAAQSIVAPTRSGCEPSGADDTGDTPAHTRKYLQSKK